MKLYANLNAQQAEAEKHRKAAEEAAAAQKAAEEAEAAAKTAAAAQRAHEEAVAAAQKAEAERLAQQKADQELAARQEADRLKAANMCNTCYGANPGCCWTCDDVLNAYRARFWWYNSVDFHQCEGKYIPFSL